MCFFCFSSWLEKAATTVSNLTHSSARTPSPDVLISKDLEDGPTSTDLGSMADLDHAVTDVDLTPVREDAKIIFASEMLQLLQNIVRKLS